MIVRCHSYADGYWADVARTYHVGPVDGTHLALYEAVFAARDAALSAIRAGVRASELDRLARTVFESHGLGSAFKHPTGHGAGFGALDHTARPRLHPKSGDVLEAGMILKLEPGAYLRDCGGVRIADMAAVTDQGAELLTPFQWSLADVTLDG